MPDRRGFRRDLRAAHRRLASPPVPLRLLQSSAGPVEFADIGEGRPVLVIHGNGGGWDHAVDWAGRRLGPGFRMIGPSRFGYLGSALPPGATLAQQADVFAELLDHLGVAAAGVVSLSAGSMTAAHLAARHPDRVNAVLFESPVVPARKPVRQPPAALFRFLSRRESIFWLMASRPSLIARASGIPWRDLDDAGRAELREIALTLLPVRPRSDGMVFDNLVAYQEILRDELPWEQVQAPALVVASADSPLPAPSDVAAVISRLPHAVWLELPRGGHLNLGNVERLRMATTAFLLHNAAD